MLKLNSTKKKISALVGDFQFASKFPNFVLFVTISPNPKTLHKVRRNIGGRRNVECKMRYEQLPQKVQYGYCLDVIRRCYLPFLSGDTKLVGTTELNKAGNVHMHLLIEDPVIKNNQTRLQMLRRDIYNCDDTIKNLPNSKKKVDWMNNIVFVNDTIEDRASYMDKDYDDNIDIFDNIYI